MNFESGVYGYIEASAKVTVYFPTDEKGRSDISCKQCKFYRSYTRTCGLNNEVCQYPDKYVGMNCPLKLDNETVNNL